MNLVLIILFYFCGQLVIFSHQSILNIASIPAYNINENDNVILKCTVEPKYTSLEWILNDDVIVTHYDGGNTEIDQGRNYNVYVAEVIAKKRNKVFKLTISSISRYDHGRWTCRVNVSNSAEFDEDNLLIEVYYRPDPQFPECLISDNGIATCSTQLGHPRVELTWLDFDGNELRGAPSSSDMMIASHINVADVSPPEVVNASVYTCHISPLNENRTCLISSKDIYSTLSITLIRNEEDKNHFICTVNLPQFVKYLTWEVQLSGNESTYNQNGIRVSFDVIDFKWNGTMVKCVLNWGAFNYTYETSYLSVNIPTTNHAMHTTKPTATTNSASNEGEVTKKGFPYEILGGAPISGDGTPLFTSGESPISSDGTPLFTSTITRIVDSEDENGGGSAVLFIILMILAVTIVLVLLAVVLFVCWKKKGPQVATII